MINNSPCRLSDVLCEIKRVVRWKQLACHLGIPIDVIECIIQDNKDSTEDQKMKAISWWLENEDATWGKLADALRQTDYRRLSDQILRKYSASSSKLLLDLYIIPARVAADLQDWSLMRLRIVMNVMNDIHNNYGRSIICNMIFIMAIEYWTDCITV